MDSLELTNYLLIALLITEWVNGTAIHKRLGAIGVIFLKELTFLEENLEAQTELITEAIKEK